MVNAARLLRERGIPLSVSSVICKVNHEGFPALVALAKELGADAVLVNTAIAIASDPVRMAKAFKKAIEAGREAWEIGLAQKLGIASATSPLTELFSQ